MSPKIGPLEQKRGRPVACPGPQPLCSGDREPAFVPPEPAFSLRQCPPPSNVSAPRVLYQVPPVYVAQGLAQSGSSANVLEGLVLVGATLTKDHQQGAVEQNNRNVFPHGLEATGSKSRCQQGQSHLEAVGENPLLLPASGGPWGPVLVSTWPSALSLCPNPPQKDTSQRI